MYFRYGSHILLVALLAISFGIAYSLGYTWLDSGAVLTCLIISFIISSGIDLLYLKRLSDRERRGQRPDNEDNPYRRKE
jgi:membrane protein implicated in regulation of membrane protease activity